MDFTTAFSKFKANYSKIDASAEHEAKRFAIFVENLKFVKNFLFVSPVWWVGVRAA